MPFVYFYLISQAFASYSQNQKVPSYGRNAMIIGTFSHGALVAFFYFYMDWGFTGVCWATGFMFLISWRGYWQELIETLVWAHERTPIANLVRWRDKPVALSIVQARLVGLVHFSVGYILTYAAFVIASTSGKYG